MSRNTYTPTEISLNTWRNTTYFMCDLKLSVFQNLITYVTGFAKINSNGTRIEIPFIAWHES